MARGRSFIPTPADTNTKNPPDPPNQTKNPPNQTKNPPGPPNQFQNNGCSFVTTAADTNTSNEAECDVPVPGIFHFFWWYWNRYRKTLVPEKSPGTGIGKIWYRKTVSEPVSEKIGTGKKSRNRYRKNLVPEKSLGTGIGKIWYRKRFLSPKLWNFEDL